MILAGSVMALWGLLGIVFAKRLLWNLADDVYSSTKPLVTSRAFAAYNRASNYVVSRYQRNNSDIDAEEIVQAIQEEETAKEQDLDDLQERMRDFQRHTNTLPDSLNNPWEK